MPTTSKVLGPRDGRSGFLGSMGVRFMVDGAESGGGFSLVEHPMSARALLLWAINDRDDAAVFKPSLFDETRQSERV